MTITPQLARILDQAFFNAKKSHHEFLTPEHVLRAALNFPQVCDLLNICGGDIENIRLILDNYINTQIPVKQESAFQKNKITKSNESAGTETSGNEDDKNFNEMPKLDHILDEEIFKDDDELTEAIENITENFIENSEYPIETHSYHEVLSRAVINCISSERNIVDITDVLVSMLDEDKNYCSYALKSSGIDRLRLLETISYMNDADGNAQKKSGNSVSAGNFGSFAGATAGVAKNNVKNSARSGILERFTVNLTKLAADGKFEGLIGREEELNRTIQILCRKTKNNPLHVGDPGVGKTVLTEGLAMRIAKGQVPANLKDAEIFSLNMTALIAGAKFRGDFEERINKILEELSKLKNPILFIDEIHTLSTGASSANGGMDAANILKPFFSCDAVRCIGSTTFEGYKKIFEKDRTLLRRFQKIDIMEPSRDEAVKILKGLRPHYENFHKVRYSDKALQTAVNLSVQFLPERRLPDKAIDIIDEAGSFVRIYKNGGFRGQNKNFCRDYAQVSVNVIKQVASKMARVPVEAVAGNEIEKIRLLETSLSSQIFGQEQAVKVLAKAVKKARAGFRNPERPQGSFLFVGPTGVGKTELARCLAKNLSLKLIRFDMSEYQEKHTVSRLIGAPPGYVGFEDGGLLTDAVRKEPNSVVLLDEIEKAHQDIFNVLLQVMDYGFLTDNQGRQADFRNCIIIMTSNAGARDMEKGSIGFGIQTFSDSVQTLKEAVDKAFSPEFRNRLDAVVPFAHLEKDIISSIVKKEIDLLAARLLERKIKLSVTPECVKFLAETGYSREFGARNIARTVDEKIAEPLADEVLFGRLSSGGKVNICLKNSQVVFDFSGDI